MSTAGETSVRAPLGAAAGVEFAVRQPYLTHDFRDAQVAVEALLRSGAKRAVHRTAHLAGNA